MRQIIYKNEKAVFHEFGLGYDGTSQYTCAVVETQSGDVRLVKVSQIKFTKPVIHEKEGFYVRG